MRLNYNIQPFARQIYNAISLVQMLQKKTPKSISCQNFYEDLNNYLPFITHSTLHKDRLFDSFWQRINKLFQPLQEPRHLHREDSNKCAWPRSVSLSHLII